MIKPLMVFGRYTTFKFDFIVPFQSNSASLGSSAPRLPSLSRTQSLVFSGAQDIALVCQAQASPPPLFRYPSLLRLAFE